MERGEAVETYHVIGPTMEQDWRAVESNQKGLMQGPQDKVLRRNSVWLKTK